jgi:hypothetical protein
LVPQAEDLKGGGMKELVIQDAIESKIYLIRGKKVMLDADLAALYGVTTKRFNEQIKRNLKRFPEDFMFQLTAEEETCLRSQFATSKKGRGGRRYLPYVFTEHGALMAANVLNSTFAIRTSVYVVRAFVKLREVLATHKELAEKLGLLEEKVGKHDQEIQAIIQAIQRLIEASHQHPKEEPAKEEPPKRRIGFRRYD